MLINNLYSNKQGPHQVIHLMRASAIHRVFLDSTNKSILLYLSIYFLPTKKETTATSITAPIMDGTNAMPARLGPQLPSNA